MTHTPECREERQLGKVRAALEEAEAGKRSIQSVLHNLFTRVPEEPGTSPELARALVASFLASPIRELLASNMPNGRKMAGRIIQLRQERGEIDRKLKPE